MKKFPRIYSLSTLNLIYHHDFDYKLHPLRTDFIGDSGSGKSMVADILQLIFVGSGAFESATQGTDKRPPQNMVLRTEGRGSHFGYAFINIEIGANKYICIGCYIQSNSNVTQSFIVQAGHNYNADSTLETFNTPLTTKDFIKDDFILPIDDFKDHINSKNLTCHVWQRLRTFHEILFNNDILPLDLSKSDKILEDYASILQSFSRKILDTGDSKSLQEFLFGNESNDTILKNYKDAVAELGTTFSEYATNLKDIEKITAKQTSLASLKTIKDSRDQSLKLWINQEIQYSHFLKHKASGELKTFANKFAFSSQKLSVLKVILEDKKKTLSTSIPELEEKTKVAQNRFTEMAENNSKLTKLNKWLLVLSCNEAQLPAKFKEYHEKLQLRKELDALTQIMHSPDVWSWFKKCDWKKGYSQGRKQLDAIISETREEIKIKNILKNFSNLDNKDSLASWAFKLDRPLSMQEESIIVHFTTLGITMVQVENKRYLPDPSKLFNDLPVVNDAKPGFWLDLRGVIEYVPKIKEQLLNTNDKQKVKAYFDKFSASIAQEITQLKSKEKILDELYTDLETLQSPSKAIEAWLQEDNLKKFKEDVSLNISNAELNTYLELLKDRKQIKVDYDEAEKNYKELNEALVAENLIVKDIDDEINNISSLIPRSKTLSELEKKHPNLIDYHDINSIKKSVSESLKSTDRYLAEARKMIGVESKNIQEQKLNELQEALQNASDRLSDVLKIADEKGLPIPETTNKEQSEPLELKSKYDNDRIQYSVKFNTTVEDYLKHDAYRFKDPEDFASLSRHLLPDAFNNVEITEDGIIEQIENYLKRILSKNLQLNQRKLQKLDGLLDEVSTVVSQQLNTVRKIKLFLSDRAKEITGGHQASLEEYMVPQFPITWIKNFRDAIRDDEGLFAQPGGITDQLAATVSLEDKMVKAFLAVGGTLSAKPTVDKLLNPFSYFGLKFGMKGMDGDPNAGSTGQTYAAIALLCIARLSLIGSENVKESDKGVRFMAIDEAEGLGSNYDMLYKIAKENDYQIISLAINPIDKFRENEQYMYLIHKNPDVQEKINLTPMGIFSEADYKKAKL